MHPLHTLFTIAVSKPTNNLRTTCPASAQAGVSQASLGLPPWGTPRRRARRLLRSRAWLPPARSSWGTRNPSTRAARRRCAAAAQAAPAERLRGGGALSPANSRQGALALTPARVAVAAGCDPAPVCVWRPHRQTMEPQGALAPAHRARTATTTWARARACACVRAHTLLSSRYCPQSLFGIAVEQAPIYIYTSAVRGAQGRGGGARKRGSNAQARLRIYIRARYAERRGVVAGPASGGQTRKRVCESRCRSGRLRRMRSSLRALHGTAGPRLRDSGAYAKAGACAPPPVVSGSGGWTLRPAPHGSGLLMSLFLLMRHVPPLQELSLVRDLQGHKSAVYSCALSPDSKWALSGTCHVIEHARARALGI